MVHKVSPIRKEAHMITLEKAIDLYWCDIFELFVWGLIDHVPHGPVACCRIPVP
jgi:hypothetical protein